MGSLVGAWISDPFPDVEIEITLRLDQHFVWNFAEAGQPQMYSGTYTEEGDFVF